MMEKQMNILLVTNSLYVMPLCVCLTSIFENDKDKKITAYIFHSRLEESEKGIILNLAKKYGQKVIISFVDESYFSDAPVLRWSKETYYRLLINEFVKEDIDRLIYLDVDTVVNKPISDLYDIDLEGFYIGALPENHSPKEMRKNLGLSESGQYFQCGVMIFDMKKTRQILSYEKSKEIIKNIYGKMMAVDQDVVNFMFDWKIKPIDKKFNNYLITSNGNFDAEDEKNTYVFHYASSKPWNKMFSGNCENIWYKYLMLSPYGKLYKGKFNTIFYKILRTHFFKNLFYKYTNITPKINNFLLKLLSPKIYASFKYFYRKHIK